MAPHLLRRAGQAVALSAVANWIAMIGSFVSMIIIARILTPADYGIFVTAIIAISLPEVIATGTLGDAIVQRKDLRDGHVNSVFLQSMVLAIAFWAILYLLAPQIALAFNNPAVAPVLRICGAMLPIGAAMSVSAALLQRDLRYKEITLVDVYGTLIAVVAGIVLALMWKNVWALVGMEFARRLARLIGFMALAKWKPKIASSWTDLVELTRFNATNAASKLIEMFDSLLPKSLIGLTLGPAAVGVFNLAERLFAQARSALVDPFAAVALPIASLVQGDRTALHSAMSNATRMAAFLAYPTFIGGFVIAPFAFPILFGDKWNAAIPIFQIYMVIALRSPMTAIISGVLRGVGRPDVVIRIAIVSIISTVVLLTLTYKYGLVAIGFALLIRQLITFVFGTWMIQRIVGFSVASQLRSGATAFYASLFMGVVVWLLLRYTPPWPHETLRLLGAIFAGGLTYMLALFCLMPRIGRHAVRAALVLLSGQPREALSIVRGAISEQGA